MTIEQLDGIRNHNIEKIKKMLELAKSENYEVCVWGAGFLGRNFGKRILSDYGIQIDYYCDNNEQLVGNEIQDNIYCCSPQRLIENKDNTICFLFIRGAYITIVYEQLVEMGIENIVTYDAILSLDETIEKYFKFMANKQVAIYTCITGDYDNIVAPKDILENCDYYVLSDKKPSSDEVYKWIDINTRIPDYITDDASKNRYCKMHPHKFFEEYKYSVYIDGNIILRGDITECIPNLKRSRIGVCAKMFIDSIYVEALRRMINGLDKPEVFLKQIKKYWYQGMPSDFGVFLCGILLREHNNPICIKIMEDWWEEYSKNSSRDQVAFPYVLWKNGYTADDVITLCGDDCINWFDESPYWEIIRGHKKKRTDKWIEDAKRFIE